MIQFYRNDENCYPKVFLEKDCFIENIEIYCSNSDKEYYDEEFINLFLETLKKDKKNVRIFLKLGTLKSFFWNIRILLLK